MTRGTAFLTELKRRRVVRVTAVYIVAALAVLQAADVLAEALRLPDSALTLAAFLAILGLPLVIALAWVFDLRDGHVERTPPMGERHEGGTVGRGRETYDAARADDLAITPSAAATHPRTAIAVLPFVNLSGNPENEYFSDGITDDILTGLARTGRLKVISRTSVMQYKGTTKDLREIGRELGVGSILEGSVRRAGERVRVTAQLIDASTDEHLWADTYDRDLSDIFAVQSEVSTSIAHALRQELSADAQRLVQRVPTRNMEAYDLVLRGRQLLDSHDPAHIRRSIELYERAATLDPNLSAAWSGMSMSLAWLAYFTDTPPREVAAEMARVAPRAVEADPDSADAHYVLGTASSEFAWDWQTGFYHMHRCLEINPGHSMAYTFLAAHHTVHVEHEKALTASRKALEYNPFGLFEIAAAGSRFLFAGEFEEAARLTERALAIDPRYYFARIFRAAALGRLGRIEEALEHAARARDDSARYGLSMGFLAVLQAAAGRREDAERTRTELVERERREYVSAYAVAQAHGALGEWDAALDALERACATRDFYLPYCLAARRFEVFNGNPRYEAILKTVYGGRVPQRDAAAPSGSPAAPSPA